MFPPAQPPIRYQSLHHKFFRLNNQSEYQVNRTQIQHPRQWDLLILSFLSGLVIDVKVQPNGSTFPQQADFEVF